MGCYKTGAHNVEMHHIFGARWNNTIYDLSKEIPEPIYMPGEFLVLPLHKDVHRKIAKLDFEEEREWYLNNLEKYQEQFGQIAPVPIEIIEYYQNMKHRYDITQGLGNLI